MATLNRPGFQTRGRVFLTAVLLLASTACQRQNSTAPRPSGDERAYLLESLRSPVRSVAIAPNGKNLAAGCHDGSIRMWDLESGQPGPTFGGHRGVVAGLAFTPDGQKLISASHDKTVILWDVNTGKQEKTLVGHHVAIWALTVAPVANLAASTGPYDEKGLPTPGDVRVWNLAVGEEIDLGNLAERHAGVSSVAISADGKGLFLACTDGDATLWNLAERKEKASFKGHRESIWRLALSRDGKMLATGDNSGMIMLWDVGTAMELHTLPAAVRDPVQDMAFSPDGAMLATVAHDRTVRLWDTATGENLAALKDEDSHPSNLAFTPDGKTLVCGRAQYDERGRPLVGDTKVWSLDKVLPDRAR